MEIIVLILLIFGGITATTTSHNDKPLLEGSSSNGEFDIVNAEEKPAVMAAPIKTEAVSNAINSSYIVYTQEGYVISNTDLIPTHKTPYGRSIEKNLKSGEVVVGRISAKANLVAEQVESTCINKSFKVNFEHNKSTLNQESQKSVSQAVMGAINCNVDNVIVSGYATKTGDVASNIALATNRANAVKHYINKVSVLKVKVLNPLSAEDTIKSDSYAIITLGDN